MRLLSLASRTCFMLTLTACTLPEPPRDAPVEPRCCENRGSCMFPQLVDQSMVELLDIDTCSENALCVPDELLLPLPARRCTLSSDGAEGRCLPACLLAAVERQEQFARDVCAADQLCLPCFDPVDGSATGACSINADRPKQPPVEPPACCAGTGRCTPAHLVTDERSLLGQDTCSEGTLCLARGASLLASEAPLSDGCLE